MAIPVGSCGCGVRGGGRAGGCGPGRGVGGGNTWAVSGDRLRSQPRRQFGVDNRASCRRGHCRLRASAAMDQAIAVGGGLVAGGDEADAMTLVRERRAVEERAPAGTVSMLGASTGLVVLDFASAMMGGPSRRRWTLLSRISTRALDW